MARKRRLATILTYLTLEVGALLGVPVRLDQIEEMTRLLHQVQVVQIVNDEESEDPPEGPPARSASP